MRKIAFFINSLTPGGAEHILVNLINAVQYKFEIDLYVIFHIGVLIDRIPRKVNCNYLYEEKNEFNIKEIALNHKEIYRQFVHREYDVEIAFLEGPSSWLVASSVNKKSKKIAWVHCDLKTDRRYEKYIDYKSLKSIYTHFNTVVCVSDGAKASFIETIQPDSDSNVIVIENPIDRDKIVYDSNAYEINFDTFTFVTICRLDKIKRVDRVIQASKTLYDLGYIFKVIIVGSGEEQENLKSLSRELGLETIIEFWGFVNNPYPIIKASNAVVVSSSSESFSCIAYETLILKKTLISTDTIGVRGLSNNGINCILTENTLNGILEGMQSVLNGRAILPEVRNINFIKQISKITNLF